MTPEEAQAVGAAWQARGVPAFPIAISWNESKSKCDKRPLTEHGHSDATLDPEVLAEQIAAKRPRRDEVLGIGLRPGAGGFVIFDGDVIHDRQAADGPGYLLTELRLPPYSYTTSTGSGGVHRWYRKRDELVEVPNVPTWEPHGIEVRSDRGWVVAPGTVTPWGTWERAEGSPDWPTVAVVPERVWIDLVGPMPGAYSAPGATSTSSKAWQRYQPAEHDEQLHPGTVEVLRWLCSPDREHPVDSSLAAFRLRDGGDPYLDLVRPGKKAGNSATLGYVAAGALKVWSSNWPGLTSGVYYPEELMSPGEGSAPVANETPGPTGERKPSTRDRLVALALERFRLGRSQDERVFIVEHDGANLALLAAAGKARLAALAYETTGAAVGRTPLEEAWQVVEGMAAASVKEPLPLRVADHDAGSVLDLGRPDGHAVLVTAAGWDIVEWSPVTFRRSKAGLGLPTPTAGGSLEPLWDVVNVPAHHRGIIRAWLAAALIRGIPHPIVQVRGEQGAAKTTATRYLGAVLDPCAVDTLAPPRDAESWAATASARWLLPVDNVSRIEPWWSDDLCRTATGAGTLKRTLYSDDDVTARLLRGCVILNGISLTSALRSDLAERLLPLDLVRPSAYMTESQVSAHFDAHHAGILGAVLDDAVTILARRPTVTAPHDLRMADFALALAALDAGTGLDSLTTYRAMHDEAAAEALEGDALALAVLELMDGRTEWHGSAADLRRTLTEIRGDLIRRNLIAEASWWPGDGAHLSAALTRSGPLLRANRVGYERQRDKRSRTVRLWITPGDAGDAGGDAAPPTGGPDSRLGDAGDAGDSNPPLLAFSSESRERDRKRNKGGAPSPPSPPSPGSGTLLDLLSPCSTCGQPNVSDPCATCRRSA